MRGPKVDQDRAIVSHAEIKNLNVKNAQRIKALMLVSSTVTFFNSLAHPQPEKKEEKKKSLKGVADSLTTLTSPMVSSRLLS